MKTYTKPVTEKIEPKTEAMLQSGSIPVKPGTVNPGAALAPEFDGLIDDKENDEL